MKQRNLNLISRIESPTPKWFRIVRYIGLALSAVGGVIATAPVSLPAGIVTLGGYLLLSGTIIGAVSQTAVSAEEYGERSRKSEGKTSELTAENAGK